MRQRIWYAVMLVASVSTGLAQQATFHAASRPQEAMVQEPQEIPLWEGDAPGALGHEESDRPTLTYYSPVYSTGTAIVLTPGGGYSFVATNHEGRQMANWLNSLGITAFVLKYRVGPRYHHPVQLWDVQRAIRQVRAQAENLRIQPNHIGVMGFSAGGHLSASVATHFDAGKPNASDPVERVSCRPDFVVLGYAVISMFEPYAHQGSVQSLLGDHPDPSLLKEVSEELHVTPQTPPAFLFSTGEDTTVPPENTLAFYQALRKAGVPAELHIFEKGGHGMGLTAGEPKHNQWKTLLEEWFRERGLLANYALPPNPDR